ncbi:MAG: hypothetical protein P1Q69_10410 [Candidatus Thorarchaeota archaeon]|nr:hypothetical protein [Candidatus Thorarchaeota archaeon]
MSEVNPLNAMLKLALATAKSQHNFFLRTAENSTMAEVKALLMVLAESEEEMIQKIQHMMITGILDEVQELAAAKDKDETPDETPFDPSRTESDPRIFVCNMALEKSIKTYTFYLTMATKTKSEVVSTLFEYLALLEMRQIKELRRICGTY